MRGYEIGNFLRLENQNVIITEQLVESINDALTDMMHTYAKKFHVEEPEPGFFSVSIREAAPGKIYVTMQHFFNSYFDFRLIVCRTKEDILKEIESTTRDFLAKTQKFDIQTFSALLCGMLEQKCLEEHVDVHEVADMMHEAIYDLN